MRTRAKIVFHVGTFLLLLLDLFFYANTFWKKQIVLFLLMLILGYLAFYFLEEMVLTLRLEFPFNNNYFRYDIFKEQFKRHRNE